VFNNEDSERSSVFTLVGRQIVNTDKNIAAVKTEINENLPKPTIESHSEGTIFSVLASPKVRKQVTKLSDQSLTKKTNDTEKLSKKIDTTNSKTTVEKKIVNDKSSSISENDYKDVKVSVNEKLNFRLSVPQELPIQSIKEFCRVMIQDKEVNQTEKLEPNKESKEDSNKTCSLSVTEKYDQTIQLPTLKSPTIVKEVMKKIASIPSGGFQQNVDIQVTESQLLTSNLQNNRSVIHYGCQTVSAGSDAEAMLVIEELDRSIEEGSPSNANSPAIMPRNNLKKNIANKSFELIKTTGPRPNKPPRLLNSMTSIEAERKMLIKVSETQTNNLIEEIYLADESGIKSESELNSQIKQSKINETVSQQKTKSLSCEKTTKEHECETPRNNDNNIEKFKNGNNLNLNCSIKHGINATNDLECAIARASLRYVYFQFIQAHKTAFYCFKLKLL